MAGATTPDRKHDKPRSDAACFFSAWFLSCRKTHKDYPMNLSQTDATVRACMDAAELIAEADGLLITAGAGISIDSGMPDFRGDSGFWRAYPGLGNLRMRFYEIANPRAFRDMPEVAWGFDGHRFALYRATAPHLANPSAAL
ncbi:hypothetical protein H3H37_10065 [Duganella sp. LX20W]|uniref:Deacetylase sirtuin-type domain-containing protein n=1 Tax=Rugamonas brunnea TaxID=2758569 RepID=A0A7W2ERQ9_9BURK|nr:hypothetical protein [Rugamonas brunnea]